MKKGRPLGFDPNKTLEIAMNIFWEKGYDRTTLEDILDAANISKSSFYNAYGNKYKIFEKSLDLFCDNQIAMVEKGLSHFSNGREFLEAFLRSIVQSARLKEPHLGCFLVNTAHEFAGRDAHVSQKLNGSTLRLNGILQEAIINGQSAGVINQRKEPGTLAFYIMSNIAGIRSMVSAQVDPDRLDEIVDVTLAALD
ncbi:MAG: TetR/AcrR family transcriptional regulator [Burkholderiales bacterium]|nr:TetR/AcrR family transcriptional regulator [Burkholderiales bacterium]MDR4518259.1 TetR/AcrR family transcriptional regulator [Nitrosomonas sp.]